MSYSRKLLILSLLASTFVFVSCSSNQKQRQEQRDKVSASSGMYCEFISGDVHNDIDIELNIQMGKRCDASRPFSLTNYKNSSENFGVIYCCSMPKKEEKGKVETRHFGPGDKSLDLDDDIDSSPKTDKPKKDTTEKPVEPVKKPEAKPEVKTEPTPSAPSTPSSTPSSPPATSPSSGNSTSNVNAPKNRAPANQPAAKPAQPTQPTEADIFGQ